MVSLNYRIGIISHSFQGTRVFSGVHVTQSLFVIVVFCISVF